MRPSFNLKYLFSFVIRLFDNNKSHQIKRRCGPRDVFVVSGFDVEFSLVYKRAIQRKWAATGQRCMPRSSARKTCRLEEGRKIGATKAN